MISSRDEIKRCIAAKRENVVRRFLVPILYTLSVVGRVVNLIDDIYGGRTSLFLTSQRMPSRYGCVDTHIQLCKYIHAVSSVGSHPDAWDIDTYTIVSDDI